MNSMLKVNDVVLVNKLRDFLLGNKMISHLILRDKLWSERQMGVLLDKYNGDVFGRICLHE